MSALFEQQLKATGATQVIVVLRHGAMAEQAKNELRGHFRLPDASQPSAIESAALAARPERPREAVPTEPAQPVRVYPNLGVMLGTVDSAGLRALRSDKDRVAKIQSAPVFRLIRPKKISPPKTTPTARLAWGIKALGIDRLWKKKLTGRGVLIGHLDTGVDGNHPVFKRKAIAHWAFFDDLGNESKEESDPFDTDEHGTHTAATIAGRPWKKGKSIYHVGVAPDAQLACAAVIEGGDSVARVLGGIEWAITKGVRVLSMSLGFPGYIDDFEFITRALRQRNILPVFAVGNEGPGTSRSPGNYAEALSVGAVDRTPAVASFSSSQRFLREGDPIVPDLLAPGVDIISAVPEKMFATMSGTSMATPHVAGLAALLFQAKPSATAEEVEKAILDSCRLPPGIPAERGNRGIPDAERALEALLR